MWYELASDWLTTSPHAHVVHFENVVRQPHTEVKDILQNYFDLPVNEVRLDCAVRRNTGSKFRRKSKTKLTREMFDVNLLELGDEYVRKMGQLLKTHRKLELPLELYW